MYDRYHIILCGQSNSVEPDLQGAILIELSDDALSVDVLRMPDTLDHNDELAPSHFEDDPVRAHANTPQAGPASS
jgi:hypothetical protein